VQRGGNLLDRCAVVAQAAERFRRALISSRVEALASALRGRFARLRARFKLCGRVSAVDSLVATALK
jgi:hypothetical protein